MHVEPAPVPPRAGGSSWPCASCDGLFELSRGWRVVHRLGGVERIAYLCRDCAAEVRRDEAGRER